MPFPAPRLITATDAVRMLSIGGSTFWKGVKDGRLPAPVKFGGATRWRVSDLQRWVCQLARATSGGAAGNDHP